MAKLDPFVKHKIMSDLQRDANDETKSENEYETLARSLEVEASILERQVVPMPPYPAKSLTGTALEQSEQRTLAHTFRNSTMTLRRMAAQEREHRANLNGLLAEIQRRSSSI